MPSDADIPEFDEQDQSEVFDEDILGDEGVGPSAEMRAFEELPDVYDVTSKLGDADVDDSLRALDADELEDEELDDLVLDDDGEDDDRLDDDLEDEPEDNEVLDDEDDLDDVDGVGDLEDDEVEVTSVGDVDAAADEDEAADYESEDELSDEDVEELGYAEDDAEVEEEEEEEDEMKPTDADPPEGSGLVPAGPGKPAAGVSGEAADMAAKRVHEQDLDDFEPEDRQDILLDEGVEETFPASDPVSVKRIT